MDQPRVQCGLVAILAADVAGYSRLMEEDEEGTLAAITVHFTELMEPGIADGWSRQRGWTARGECQRDERRALRCRV